MAAIYPAPVRLLLPLILAVCFGGCDHRPAAPEAVAIDPAELDLPAGRLDRSKAGTPAPAAAFEDPAGEPVTLAEFRGKPLLVNLWATWCAPCIAEMPTLDAFAARDGPIEVLAISQDLGGQEKVDAFFAKRRFRKLEPYVDPDMALMGELKLESLPTTILYDAQGRELWRMTGIEDWTGDRAARLLKEASR
ncbi:MAG TPA: redoxin family protein [Allosphingosinicella sp.]|nr:redoxin family protein [Allosphingosinicella sp.]